MAATGCGGRKKAACRVSILCLFGPESGLAVLSGAVFLLKMLPLSIRCPDVMLGPMGVGDTVVFPPAGPQLLLFLPAMLLKPIYEGLSACSKVLSVRYGSPFGGGSLTVGKALNIWTLNAREVLSQGSWLPSCFVC